MEQGAMFLESEGAAGTICRARHGSVLARHAWLGEHPRHGARDRRPASHDRRDPLAVVRRAVHRRPDLHAALRESRAAAARAAAFGGDLRRSWRPARRSRRRATNWPRFPGQMSPGVSAHRTAAGSTAPQTAREWQYGSMRAPLLMLFAATAFVLLIACVNIANLTSAQAIARAGELSLRLALGASQRRRASASISPSC